jgi:two-component system, LytTR family, sensor kinase
MGQDEGGGDRMTLGRAVAAFWPYYGPVLSSPAMLDDPGAAERRRQLANTVFIVAGFSAARGLMETAWVVATRQVSGHVAFVWTLPSWLLLLPLAAGTVVLAGRFPFERGNRARSVVVHVLACAVFGLIHLSGITPFRVLLAGEPLNWPHVEHAFVIAVRLLLYLDVLTYWAIVGMYLALHYSNLRTSLAEARLAVLRAQLNPHFLFNTLNAISTLALKGDQPAVTETIGRLSGLLRAALDEHTEEISLTREMEFLEDYVAIQRIRFADRLCVKTELATDTLDGLVPTMILQPIVENAIKHGVNAQRGPGHVSVSAVRNNGSLVIEVRDTGPGFRHADTHAGIGLTNTRARLEQLYGTRYLFEYGSRAEGGASVLISIPFHERPT